MSSFNETGVKSHSDRKSSFDVWTVSLVPSLSWSSSLSVFLKLLTHELIKEWNTQCRLWSFGLCLHLFPQRQLRSCYYYVSPVFRLFIYRHTERLLVVEWILSSFSYRWCWFCSHVGTHCVDRGITHGRLMWTWFITVLTTWGECSTDLQKWGAVRHIVLLTLKLNESHEPPCVHGSSCLCPTTPWGGGVTLNSP